MHPWLVYHPNEVDEDLGNHISVPVYDGESTTSKGFIHLKYEPDQGDIIVYVTHTTGISQGTVRSLHDWDDDSTIATVPASRKWKGAIIVQATNQTPIFNVFDSTADDATTGGTNLFDYSRGSFAVNDLVTSPILDFTASRRITIEVDGIANDQVIVPVGVFVESDA